MSADRAVLALHILVGLLETFRFALLDLFRPPVADLLDVALCLVQSLTNVLLVRRMTRGLAYFTRTSLLSPIPSRSSFLGHQPIYHYPKRSFARGPLSGIGETHRQPRPTFPAPSSAPSSPSCPTRIPYPLRTA